MIAAIVLPILAVLVLIGSSVRLVQQYEKGVVLRFGRLLPGLRQPGLRLLIPFSDRMRKVSMQTVVMGIPAQGAITRDNVTLTVDAVVYFRVIDPVKAVINVQHYPTAVSQVAQTSLRSIIGRADLDTLLSDRDQINAELQAVIDTPTEEPWGIHIERVEVKDVALPDGMKRSMSRQAEAERERRARVIAADGEFQASAKLAEAARTMGDTPGALQLRLLQTVVDVAAEKNSTLVCPSRWNCCVSSNAPPHPNRTLPTPRRLITPNSRTGTTRRSTPCRSCRRHRHRSPSGRPSRCERTNRNDLPRPTTGSGADRPSERPVRPLSSPHRQPSRARRTPPW